MKVILNRKALYVVPIWSVKSQANILDLQAFRTDSCISVLAADHRQQAAVSFCPNS